MGISNNPLISRELGFDEPFDDFVQGEEIFFESRGSTQPESYGKFSKVQSSYSDSGIRGVESLLEYKLRKKLTGDIRLDSGCSDSRRLLKNLLGEYSFYFLNLMEPHAPYKSHGLGKLYDRPKYKYSREISESVFPRLSRKGSSAASQLYRKEIRYLDKELSKIYDMLKSELDDFLLLITSDHGENFGERGFYDHQYALTEPTIRVPLIAAGPEISPESIDRQTAIQNIPEFVKSGLDTTSLIQNNIEASYKGALGFYDEFSDFETSDYSSEEQDYLNNQSYGTINGSYGVIENSHIEDSMFVPTRNGERISFSGGLSKFRTGANSKGGVIDGLDY